MNSMIEDWKSKEGLGAKGGEEERKGRELEDPVHFFLQ